MHSAGHTKARGWRDKGVESELPDAREFAEFQGVMANPLEADFPVIAGNCGKCVKDSDIPWIAEKGRRERLGHSSHFYSIEKNSPKW